MKGMLRRDYSMFLIPSPLPQHLFFVASMTLQSNLRDWARLDLLRALLEFGVKVSRPSRSPWLAASPFHRLLWTAYACWKQTAPPTQKTTMWGITLSYDEVYCEHVHWNALCITITFFSLHLCTRRNPNPRPTYFLSEKGPDNNQFVDRCCCCHFFLLLNLRLPMPYLLRTKLRRNYS